MRCVLDARLRLADLNPAQEVGLELEHLGGAVAAKERVLVVKLDRPHRCHDTADIGPGRGDKLDSLSLFARGCDLLGRQRSETGTGHFMRRHVGT